MASIATAESSIDMRAKPSRGSRRQSRYIGMIFRRKNEMSRLMPAATRRMGKA
jgi:hypothetical protein